MKLYLKMPVALILLALGAAASGQALAQHHGGVRFGINIGIPLFGPGYYPPYAYPAPAYAYPAPAYAYPAPAYGYAAPAYVYPAPGVAPSVPNAAPGYPQATVAPTPQQDWFFCSNSDAYYPHVRDCPGGWQRVPAQPPR